MRAHRVYSVSFNIFGGNTGRACINIKSCEAAAVQPRHRTSKGLYGQCEMYLIFSMQ